MCLKQPLKQQKWLLWTFCHLNGLNDQVFYVLRASQLMLNIQNCQGSTFWFIWLLNFDSRRDFNHVADNIFYYLSSMYFFIFYLYYEVYCFLDVQKSTPHNYGWCWICVWDYCAFLRFLSTEKPNIKRREKTPSVNIPQADRYRQLMTKLVNLLASHVSLFAETWINSQLT